MRIVDMNGDDFAAMMQHAARMGRRGDTDLVHVNEHEKKILKELGGAGTINPKTGLREYGPQGDQAREGNRSGGSSSGGGGNERAEHGNFEGRSRAAGGFGNESGTTGGRGGSKNDPGKGGEKAEARNKAAMAAKSSAFGGSAAEDEAFMNELSATVDTAIANKKAAQADFEGEEEDFFDKIGNFIAGMFGASEIDPETQALKDFMDQNVASWDIDPVQAVLGAAGLANPAALLASKGWGAVKGITGYRGPTIGISGNFTPAENPSGLGTGKSAGNVSTASGKKSGSVSGKNVSQTGGNQGRDTVRQNDKYPGANALFSRGGRGHTTEKPVKPATPPAAEPVKSPADILLDRFKLPGINAPLALSPYTIDQTQHTAMVQSIMQGRA